MPKRRKQSPGGIKIAAENKAKSESDCRISPKAKPNRHWKMRPQSKCTKDAYPREKTAARFAPAPAASFVVPIVRLQTDGRVASYRDKRSCPADNIPKSSDWLAPAFAVEAALLFAAAKHRCNKLPAARIMPICPGDDIEKTRHRRMRLSVMI